MIQFDRIKKSYGGDILFEEISFTISQGEKCGLVGRNGSGKTTLFRLMTGEESSDEGNIAKPKNYSIGYLNQHLSFSASTLIEEAALGLPESDKGSIYKAERILFGLGFQEKDLERSPHEFSGGYHLRLHLAKVLLSEPDCLLLDEPTNYLDILSLRWLARFLRSWKGEFILISHDRQFMDSVTTHTLCIHRKKMSKIKGGTEHLFAKILEEEELFERTRVKLETKREHAEEFIRRFGAKNTKASQAQSRMKALERLPGLEKLAQLYNLDFSFSYASFPGKKMISLEDVSFGYPEAPAPVIKSLSFQVENRERIAIIGKNGSGKSTILRLLAGHLSPLEGMVQGSSNLSIGYFGQTNIDSLIPSKTIEEEIMTANSLLSYSDVRDICGVMMFSGDLAKKTISVLSGGERSRVLLGKILATSCNLLLLDEPTHHLDMESVEALTNALEAFEGSVILVTHSEQLLRQISMDKLIICHSDRQQLFLGNYDEFLEKQGWEEEADIKPKPKSSMKDQKRLSAEHVQARSKVLRPLQEQMEIIEKQIAQQEKEYAQESQRLIQVSELGQSGEIQKLSKALAERKNRVDALFLKWEAISHTYEQKKIEFSQDLQS